jgi:hypothetical protein
LQVPHHFHSQLVAYFASPAAFFGVPLIMAVEIPEQAAEYFRIDDSPEIIDHLQLYDRVILRKSPTQSFISAYAAHDLGKVSSTLVPFPPVSPCVFG